MPLEMNDLEVAATMAAIAANLAAGAQAVSGFRPTEAGRLAYVAAQWADLAEIVAIEVKSDLDEASDANHAADADG